MLWKVGFPPALALVMLIAVAGVTSWSQQRQTLALVGLLRNNGLQNQIAVDAQRITADNGRLYAILTRQAAGAPPAERQAELTYLQRDLDAVQENLRALRPSLARGQRPGFDAVWQNIEAYQHAIQVLGSMRGADFSTSASFIQSFEANDGRMTATLNDASNQLAAASMQQAQDSTGAARRISLLTLILVGGTALVVAAISWVIVRSVRRTMTESSRKSERIEQERIVRMITVLSESNEAILRAETREKLFAMVCEAAALGGGFTVTNILVPQPGSRYLKVVAAAGPSAAVPMHAQPVLADALAPEQELVKSALHRKAPAISNDYLAEQRHSAVYEMTRDTGTRSGAALPLFRQNEVVACMLVMSPEPHTFTPEFVKILQRLASTVSVVMEFVEQSAERQKAEERIRYLATHDSLTNLPNRAAFNQLLNFSIRNAQRYERKCAILLIDLDRFKLINDSLGHAAGEALLIEMAGRLRSALRASDVVARLGGDEFIILVNEISDHDQADAVAQHLLSTLSTPLELSGHECRITASIGIALYPDDGDDEQTLMKNADIAMYFAKAEGKNDVRFFSREIKTQSIDQLKIESSLRHAIERNEFTLHYQPKLDIATGRIAGVEALLRWTHPELGLLPPMQFIPLAEETGMIVSIGKWVLNTACAQNMAWQHAGYPALSMAINVSPRQFSDENLLRDIDDALGASGMDPRYLQIEITESMVMVNIERTVRILDAIQSRGVRLAIDDFGTGYSSMSMLKRFPIDTIKIDRSFVRDLPSNSEDKAIARAIIGMGKALGLTIVAEGVETLEQDAFLREHACDEIQGYLFSRPIAADNIAALLRHTKAHPPASPPENFTSTFHVSEPAVA